MHLRPYQELAVDSIRACFARGVRRPLLVMPCGAGKTTVFSYIAKGVSQRGKRVLILAHRRELLNQISRSLETWRVRHSIVDAECPGIPRTNVVVGSVFTVNKRLDHMPNYDLIIQDEAHHCSGTNTFSRVLQKFPAARQLGVTATPARASMEPMGASFDEIVYGPDVATLTAMGYLAPLDVYAPSTPDLSGVHVRAGDYAVGELDNAMNKPVLVGNAVEHYKKYADNKLAVAFCVSVSHSKAVADAFNNAGYRAAHVDGKMDMGLRDATLRKFSNGHLDVLTSCSLIAEGWDCPTVEVGLMLRPTESMPLFMQMIGRLVRTHPGKQKAILLDAAGNTVRHGFLDDPREWTLDGIAQQATEHVPRVATCKKCFAAYSPGLACCPRCGYVPEVVGRKIRQVDGELEQIVDGNGYASPETSDPLKDMERQYYALRGVARKRSFHNPESWAFRIVSARLADRMAREKQDSTAALEDLEMRTIRRDTVTRAMSGE